MREPLILPYSDNALEPTMSAETVLFHFRKHYMAYLTNYNRLKNEHSEYGNSTLEDVIKHSDGALYNNAAQVLNHELFFSQFSDTKGLSEPKGVLLDAIKNKFISFAELKKLMTEKSLSLFGSGWVWLALDGNSLVIAEGSNAYNPIVEGMHPLLAIDVWEHAYYIDNRNNRTQYLEKIWAIIDWQVIEERYVECVNKD